ncbi:MAG TPA: hypothetical protein VKB38_22610 [Terracidiphilus sp.]|nr:hypothetical protein [Terracidiphilus sp.]
MATTSFTTARRFAGIAISLLMSLWLCGNASGQNAAPLVTASSATGLSHPTGWGAIQQTAIDAAGDWLVVDYVNGSVYEFPAGGGAAIPIGGVKALAGGYENPGIAIDPGNNLYLEANWNNCLLMFPWDPVAKTWTGLDTMTPDNPSTSLCTNSGKGNSPYAWAQYSVGDTTGLLAGSYFQPWGITAGNNNNLIIGIQGGSAGMAILGLSVNSAWSNPTANAWNWLPVSGLQKRPISVAQDQKGNAFFVEDSGGRAGVLEIPANTANGQYQSVTSGGVTTFGDASLPRVDPNLPNVTGVVTDSAGNLYISDSTVGVVMVPNTTGVPDTANAVVATSVPGQGEVAFDWTRNTMYVPTNQKQTNGQADVAKVNFGYAEFGSTPVGTAATAGPNVAFGFNGSATPSRFIIVEDGVSTPDFAITGGTCTTGTAYASGNGCLQNVAFNPTTVGSVSAKLLMQKAEAEPKGSPDASDSITAFSASSGILTLTAANKLVPGELVQFSASGSNDALQALDGQQFNVMAAGLDSNHFAIQTGEVTGSGPTQDGKNTTSATVTGYVYSTLASIVLHGTGLGANIQAVPALESAVGANLKTPSQVAIDYQGNVYAADAGLGKVVMFPAGAGTSAQPVSVGSGLTAPTGVAVDGAGDIFIADNSGGTGTVYEIPSQPTGRESDGGQVQLVTGLGANLNLAIDNVGSLYIADPTNGRVVKLANVGAATSSNLGQAQLNLTTGFTAPSAVAVDTAGNLYVIDGSDLFELAGGTGAPTSLLNNLSGATGLAVDPSGAVYVTSASGTIRIPFESGALAPGDQMPIAPDLTNSSSVALDRWGNAYIVSPAGGAVTLVSVSGTLALPTPASLTSSTTATAVIVNSGNAPLTVTGYTSANAVDFTGADGTCVGDGASGVAPGATCQVVVTFNPGAGEEGPLTGQVGITSNAVNSPIVINAFGTGLPLAHTATAVKVAGSAEVVNSPLSVTVSSKSGTGPTPTGEVTVSFPSWTVVPGPNGAAPMINPITSTVKANLDSTGAATFQLAPVLAGSQTFTVAYNGDRVYGRSTGTMNQVVAKSAVQGIALPAFPDKSDINLPFVPAGTGGGTVPYDGTQTPWQYNFKMAVNTAVGVPTGSITMMDDSSTCPAGTSATGIGTATCVLTGYKGVACPQSSGSAVMTIQNAGTPSGAQASFPTTCLWNVPQGTTYSPVIYTHSITPVYSGDANFLAYNGPTSTLLQSVRGPQVQITQTGNAASSTAAPALSVTSGSSASIDLTLTSILGYGFVGKNGQLNDSNFPVALNCDIPLPHASCAVTYDNSTVDPNQVTASNSVQIPCPASATPTQIADGTVQCTPGHATVTVYTNVTAGTSASRNAGTASVALAGIFGLGMIGLFFRRRALQKYGVLLMVVLMIVGASLAISLTACGTTNLSPQTHLSTPAGSYQMTITAQSVGSQCVPLVGPGSNCTTSSGGSGVTVYASNNQVSIPFYVNVTVK